MFGHVVKMSEERKPRQVLDARAEGKREIPRIKREDYVVQIMERKKKNM